MDWQIIGTLHHNIYKIITHTKLLSKLYDLLFVFHIDWFYLSEYQHNEVQKFLNIN